MQTERHHVRYIEELDFKIIEVKAEYSAIHNASIPVLALPPEITCAIFRFASGYRTKIFSEERNHQWSEIIVSHVCHQWRSISLSYPRLWASFCHGGHIRDVRLLPKLVDRFDAYLERSASQSLELYLDFRETCLPLYLLTRMILHAERWKYVTFKFADKDSPAFLLAEIKTLSAPNLEYFAFSSEKPNSLGSSLLITSLAPQIFISGAPKLQYVRSDCSTVLSLPPLSDITTLCLESPGGAMHRFSFSAFLNILSIYSLMNLSVVGMVIGPPDIGRTIPVITMNKLRHLRLDEYGASLLTFLRSPLLETLSIQDVWFLDTFGQESSYAFPSLQSVSLVNVWGTPKVAWQFARMTESATEILVSQKNLDESFLSVLQNSKQYKQFSNETYWPKMKLLTLHFKPTDTSGIATFLGFAKARAKNDLVFQIFGYLDRYYRENSTTEYDSLVEIGTIKTMGGDNNPLTQHWPPGAYNLHRHHLHANDADFFDPYYF